MLDFRAGFEDSVRGAITSLDWAVVIVDPIVASVLLAVHMHDPVAQMQSGDLPATHHHAAPSTTAIILGGHYAAWSNGACQMPLV